MCTYKSNKEYVGRFWFSYFFYTQTAHLVDFRCFKEEGIKIGGGYKWLQWLQPLWQPGILPSQVTACVFISIICCLDELLHCRNDLLYHQNELFMLYKRSRILSRRISNLFRRINNLFWWISNLFGRISNLFGRISNLFGRIINEHLISSLGHRTYM